MKSQQGGNPRSKNTAKRAAGNDPPNQNFINEKEKKL
jgi:hypothetical protein